MCNNRFTKKNTCVIIMMINSIYLCLLPVLKWNLVRNGSIIVITSKLRIFYLESTLSVFS